MWYVYIIQSERAARSYVGITTNLNKRLASHNRGATKSTKAWAPWKLVYYDEFSNKEEAVKREKFYKSSSGREFLRTKL
jgi:putative endonuclease